LGSALASGLSQGSGGGVDSESTYNRLFCVDGRLHRVSSFTSIFMKPVVYMCVAAFVAALTPDAPAAEPTDIAHGTFKSQAITLDVRSAIAFKGKSYLGPDDVLIVAVTNARVHGDALAEYYDRKRAVEKRIKDDDTGVVYFEFRPDGSYRGLSYYFVPGNGCGFCTSEVASTVRLGGGRLSGTLRGTEKDRPFEVVLNVPVMSDDHGSALPAGGGAPGAAYLAYHAALVKRDRATLKPLLSLDRQQTWADAEKKGDVSKFVDYLAAEHPDKSLRIVRGFVKGDTAVLLVSGESLVGSLVGEALLKKEKDAWRVDDELMDLGSR
jgi:hypothetical protein